MYRDELDFANPTLLGERAARAGLSRAAAPAEYRPEEAAEWVAGYDRAQKRALSKRPQETESC